MNTLPASDAPDIIAKLCLKCGLCCDGTIFADVELRDDAETARLKAAGLQSRRKRTGSAPRPSCISQPCAALGTDCHCAVYEDRPAHCREFECLLFGEVANGTIRPANAQRIVSRARRLSSEARNLMDTLTDEGKGEPPAGRFRMIAEMLEEYDPDEETLAVFGELTMVWQDLVHLLGTRFYRESS